MIKTLKIDDVDFYEKSERQKEIREDVNNLLEHFDIRYEGNKVIAKYQGDLPKNIIKTEFSKLTKKTIELSVKYEGEIHDYVKPAVLYVYQIKNAKDVSIMFASSGGLFLRMKDTEYDIYYLPDFEK